MTEKILKKIKNLLILGRYNYPTGGFLLFWPCIWGLFYQIEPHKDLVEYIFLFFIGSFVMRGAGCCINDLFDQNFDKQVSRTKKRPLASGQLKNIDALIFIIFQLIIGLIVVLNLKFKVIFFSFIVIPLVFSYPLFKRITFFPQILLGVIFNWGILIGFLTQNDQIDHGIIFLYLAGVFFTIAYDTIYAHQDIKDDKRIGVKSIAILFEKKSTHFLLITYICSLFFFTNSIILKDEFSKNFLVLFFFIITSCFLFQYINFKKRKNLKLIFDSCNLVGGVIATLLFSQNYL